MNIRLANPFTLRERRAHAKSHADTAGAKGKTAAPMTAERREAIYSRNGALHLTPAQRRRASKKARAASARDAA